MHSCRLSPWCVLVASLLLLAACARPPPKPPDPAQKELDRFVDLIANGMWSNGADRGISAKPNAPDEELIATTAEQLNNNPAPLKEWHLLKKEHVGPADFNAHWRKKHPELYPAGIGGPSFDGPSYLVAVIDSDQGHKIVVIDEYQFPSGGHWARMYNCDAVFSSPMNGGFWPLGR